MLDLINIINRLASTNYEVINCLFATKSCDASLLLETVNGIESEKASQRSFGMRNFKYVNTIKAALESECPVTVSCADIVALSARDGIVMVRVYIYTSRNQSTMKSKTGNLRDLILKCDYS